MNLRNTRISTLLTAGFAAMALLILLLGALAWSKLNAMDAHFKLAMEDRYPKVKSFQSIKDTNNQVARSLRNLLIRTDKAEIDAEFAIIEQASKSTAATIDELTKIMTTPGGKAGIVKLNEARATYRMGRDKVTKALRAG
ncbi:MAG TPA: MCP four helix bundle domain-containing protein, partial [Roseateles sp.]|nr:MCP four helix bundle domain-containing protein [Roseateles sp.]